MRIDYCPECGKAGLKWKNLDNPEDPLNWKYEVGQKWCPRCKKWVKSENRAYIALRDRI